jgi:hypothetical protein
MKKIIQIFSGIHRSVLVASVIVIVAFLAINAALIIQQAERDNSYQREQIKAQTELLSNNLNDIMLDSEFAMALAAESILSDKTPVDQNFLMRRLKEITLEEPALFGFVIFDTAANDIHRIGDGEVIVSDEVAGQIANKHNKLNANRLIHPKVGKNVTTPTTRVGEVELLAISYRYESMNSKQAIAIASLNINVLQETLASSVHEKTEFLALVENNGRILARVLDDESPNRNRNDLGDKGLLVKIIDQSHIAPIQSLAVGEIHHGTDDHLYLSHPLRPYPMNVIVGFSPVRFDFDIYVSVAKSYIVFFGIGILLLTIYIRAESRIQKSEQDYEALLENAVIGIGRIRRKDRQVM